MLRIVKDGINVDRKNNSGRIRCIADFLSDIPIDGTMTEDLFSFSEFPFDAWHVNNVIISLGIFIKVDLVVGDSAAFGYDSQGHALSAWSQEYGQYELQPRQYTNGGITWLSFNPNFTVEVYDWKAGEESPVPGPWVSWSVTFEASKSQKGLVGAVNPSLAISEVASGSLLCVDLSCKQNHEQRERGVWQTSATFWIAPAGLIWKPRS